MGFDFITVFYAIRFLYLLRVSINYLLIYDLGTLLDGQPIINLPPKTINLSKVDFSVEERSFYTKLESDSRSQFKVLFLRSSKLSVHPFVVTRNLVR